MSDVTNDKAIDRVIALQADPLDSNDLRAWVTLARKLARELDATPAPASELVEKLDGPTIEAAAKVCDFLAAAAVASRDTAVREESFSVAAHYDSAASEARACANAIRLLGLDEGEKP